MAPLRALTLISILILTSTTLTTDVPPTDDTPNLLPRKVALVKGDDKKVYGDKVGAPIDALAITLFSAPDCGSETFDVPSTTYSQNVAPEFKTQGAAIHSFKLSRELRKGETIDFSSKAPANVNMKPAKQDVDPKPQAPKAEPDGGKSDFSEYNIYYMENAVLVNRNPAKDAKPFGKPEDTKNKGNVKRQAWTDDEGNVLEESEEEEGNEVFGGGNGDGGSQEESDEGKGTSLAKRAGPDMTAGLDMCARYFGSWDKKKIKGPCVNLNGAANCFRIWLAV